jgi:predicted nucleic acid-binding protein
VLIYAYREDSSWRSVAAARVEVLAEGSAAWAIPWPCLHEFLAIVTHPRIYNPPTPLVRARDQVDAWIESPSLVLLAEGDEYWPTLRTLVTGGRVTGPAIHDARIAAAVPLSRRSRPVECRPGLQSANRSAGEEPSRRRRKIAGVA